jgi:acetyltransferase-like isoleucine patch superfamily enzyme
MKKIVCFLLLILPWHLRRLALIAFFGYKIHPTARIGLSLICPDRLEMDRNSRIGNLSVCKGLSLLRLNESALIGNLNWITGYPIGDRSSFGGDIDRRPELVVGEHAAITNRHWLDCTNAVDVGRFSTVAGCYSQVLTHSIDLVNCRQASKPIRIGEYCFLGTGSILLGGSSLPDYSVLGAGSLLIGAYQETHFLYGGVPAKAIKTLPAEMGYFQRKQGFVQ